MIYNSCLHAFIYHKDVFYVPTSSFRRKMMIDIGDDCYAKIFKKGVRNEK